ncbi:protein kinase domain-containing protein [Streptacidiphilus rugosus]|uniref:serine/threonine-protein kinase n=1 Tax=Streptacidiphilus rugosus TaxID=405783 RepID=UPI00055EF7FA|nr:serine/threonine-protein kinase [Streptacidiphilus rugosus]
MQPLENDDPSSIGPYRLVARLGAGGMGRVYLARSAGGRTVAVKVVRAELADSADFRARFRREVAAAQAVDAAYTARVVDADRDSATPWLATSYVLGPSLNEAVAAHGPLPEHSVRALGAVLAEALRSIHGAGLIHRDLKPSNVLLAADGPRVIDFGIARALDGGELTGTGVVVGSPGFMSPEQASGRPVGPEGDVFSLGSVLAFAATGHGPFGQDSVASLLYRVVHDTPDLDAVPPGLREAVGACLAKAPADRPSPEQLLTMLAPDGAAALLRGSWLPAEVASGIAQHAARVMELETPLPRETREQQDQQDPRRLLGADPRTAGPADRPDHGTFVLGGTPDAGAPTPPVPPTTAPAPASPAASVPSRRKVLYGVVGVAVLAAGGTAAALSSGGGRKPTPSPSGSGSAGPSVRPTTFPSRAAGVPPQPLWTYPASQKIESPAVAVGGVLLVPDQKLMGLDARSGAVKWTGPQIAAGIQSPVALSAGLVVTLPNDGDKMLAGYDPATGARRWTFPEPTKYGFDSVLGANDDYVFIIGSQYKLDGSGKPIITFGDTSTAVVMALDPKSQSTAHWTQHRNTSANWDVQGFATSKYLVYTNSANNVVVRDTATGNQIWSKDYGDPTFTSTEMPLLGGDALYLPGPQLLGFGLDKGDQRLQTSKVKNVAYEFLAYADGVVYSTRGNDTVVALDAHNGAVQWSAPMVAPLTGGPMLVVGDTLFCPTLDDSGDSVSLLALNRHNGQRLWTFQDGSGDDWWLSTDGTVLFAAHGSRVYALPPV